MLAAWQGLGYNRRALALHRLAGVVVSEHAGVIPRSVEQLQRLPGIGYATAAAVCVYAYEQPLAFIETNVRSAFIHFFFQECSRVADADLLPLVELTLDRERPRDWYYALMDYGAWLKKTERESRPAEHASHGAVAVRRLAPPGASAPACGCCCRRPRRVSASTELLAADDTLAAPGPARGGDDPLHAGLGGLSRRARTGVFRVAS